MSDVQWPTGWDVQWVETTGSTNADLVAQAQRSNADRVVLAADFQTAGRGRLDRTWDAPAGANLLVSFLFRDVPVHRHELTQRIAMAARSACQLTAGLSPDLKWPNDLLLDGAKLAGILAQGGVSPDGPFVVVGLGLNVGWAPPDGAKLGEKISPRQVLVALLGAYDALPALIHPLYKSHLATLGQLVRVEMPGDQLVVGRAVDVEPDGRLVVLDDCAITHRIDTGDVVHLRRLT
jgi:BirA family transcriptional regulator, biotin operon repressor / biotin---[acetyl-CoA-carboxylase] ligase